jgi:hypothetical protein
MFQHIAAKVLLPKAALLIWSAAGLRNMQILCGLFNDPLNILDCIETNARIRVYDE